MQTFNIFKPDMWNKPELVEVYLRLVKSELGLEPTSIHTVKDWIAISKILYELDTQNENMSPEEIRLKRKQIITSLMAYDHFYSGCPASVVIFDILEDEEKLRQFYHLKKAFRKCHVYNQPKHYVKFLNEDAIDFTQPLTEIDHREIKSDFIVAGPYDSYEELGYNLAFFNKVHSPDPDVDQVARELSLLNEAGIFAEENKARLVRTCQL